jgi:hypothetical protein
MQIWGAPKIIGPPRVIVNTHLVCLGRSPHLVFEESIKIAQLTPQVSSTPTNYAVGSGCS